MSRRTVCWSELPSELLTSIATRLGTQTDTCNFRSVRKEWLASTQFSQNHPQNLLSPIVPYKFSLHEGTCVTPFIIGLPIILTQTSFFVIRSTLETKVPRLPWLCRVEELDPGKLHPHRALSRNVVQTGYVPQNLKLSYFKVVEVGRFYRLRYSDFRDNQLSWDRQIFAKMKVVLIVDPNYRTFPRIDDYSAVVLTDDGTLQLILLKNGSIKKITGPNIKVYDDVVGFRGRIFVIDRKGRAYTKAYNDERLHIVISTPVGEGSGSDRKKRLVQSCTGELYLVHRCAPYFEGKFRLFKLNEKTCKWDRVEGIGSDRILIVSSDGCFFANVEDFPGWKGNCMVFGRGQFPCYSSDLAADTEFFGSNYLERHDLDAVVFSFDDGSYKRLKEIYPQYTDLIWPPPEWISSDTALFDSESMAGINILREHYKHVASEPTSKVEMADVEATLAMNDEDRDKQGACPQLTPSVTGPLIIDTVSLDVTAKASEKAVSLGKFKGINVCSSLVPVLEKIWENYGDVAREHVVQTSSLLRWAFESLAQIVLFIKTNSTSKSLTDPQAKYLRATLKDLQLLHIKVDWLVPFVDKLLALPVTYTS